MTNKNEKIILQFDRDLLCKLLIMNKWNTANDIAKILGYKEGITALFFEDMIKKEGLTQQWITAIATYYAKDIETTQKEATR